MKLYTEASLMYVWSMTTQEPKNWLGLYKNKNLKQNPEVHENLQTGHCKKQTANVTWRN